MNRPDQTRGAARRTAAAVVLLAFAAAPGALVPAGAMDGAILVVSAADGPMPAPELERSIRQALEAAKVQYSETDLAFLGERAARALPSLRSGARLTVCTEAGSPCVTLLRE